VNSIENKKYIDIKELLENKVEDIDIPGIGVIQVRMPTIRDRIEAEKEASTHPAWNNMDAMSKRIEVEKRLARRVLVKPKISVKDYMNCNDIVTTAILDTVSGYIGLKVNELNKKRKALMDFFIQQMGR